MRTLETADHPSAAGLSPLEAFLRDYVETVGGVWDEIEPQVYDLLLPVEHNPASNADNSEGILRVAFDPEALPEHAGAQLASFGTPLVDRLLETAARRGCCASAFVNGLNLSPYDLEQRIRRPLRIPDGADLEHEQVRVLDVRHAVFWFQVVFASDQKEQEILTIAFDLHTQRQVRRLSDLLDPSRLADQPAEYRLEARGVSAAAAFPLARDQVLRTVSSLANTRRRELAERVERQIGRMRRYYNDLREETRQQQERASSRGADLAKFPPRLEAIAAEESLRVSELRQKSRLRVKLRLVSLLSVRQPKLFIKSKLLIPGALSPPDSVELTWDPLTETLEAIACPQCESPTYELLLTDRRRIGCPQCRGRQSRRSG